MTSSEAFSPEAWPFDPGGGLLLVFTCNRCLVGKIAGEEGFTLLKLLMLICKRHKLVSLGQDHLLLPVSRYLARKVLLQAKQQCQIYIAFIGCGCN